MKYPGKYGTPWRQLRALTLEEKASLLSGHGFWRTKAIPEKGVKSLFMADGPHGVRKEDKLHTRRNGGASVPATCFPCEGTLACSFSPYLVQCVGRAMGEEAAAQGVGLLLGPGLNHEAQPFVPGAILNTFPKTPPWRRRWGRPWCRASRRRAWARA